MTVVVGTGNNLRSLGWTDPDASQWWQW
jgi:hypothetical protein